MLYSQVCCDVYSVPDGNVPSPEAATEEKREIRSGSIIQKSRGKGVKDDSENRTAGNHA